MSESRWSKRRWTGAGEEPNLAEVLADPVVHAVMRRDGVTFVQLHRVITRAQAMLRVTPCRCAA